MRGATGGDKFHQTLVGSSDKDDKMDTEPPRAERRQRSLSTLTKAQEPKAAQMDRDAVMQMLTQVTLMFHYESSD